MKKYLIALLISFFIIIPSVSARNFFIQHPGTSNVTLKNNAGVSVSYSMYKYETTEGYEAYCLDPNLSSGANGQLTYSPGLEETHSKNLYNYWLGTGEKEFPAKMIRIGQNYVDTEGYEYKDMSEALRMWWFESGWNVEWSLGKNYGGASKDLYDYFAGYSGDALIGNAKKLYDTNNYAKGVKQNDGFTYDGFWEAKYKQVDKDIYPGYKKQADGTWTYDAMYKTNIRHGGLSCDNITYNHDIFECEIIEQADELIDSKSVDWIHLKSKVDLDGSGFIFYITYIDAREANNFWISYARGTENSYGKDTSKIGKQRMYIIDKGWGNMQIPVGTITTPPTTTPKTSVCEPDVKDKDCDNDSDFISSTALTKTFTIGDDISDNSCVFKEANVNHTITDNSSGYSSTTNFTQNYNEYCSLTCAEQISVTLPSEVAEVFAGRYWTWNSDNLMISGTRICNARVALDQYKKDLGITNYDAYARDADSVKARLTGSSGILNLTVVKNDPPLKVQLQDLIDANNEYNNADTLATKEDADPVYTTCSNADGSTYSCIDYYNCIKYTFESAYTGETHVKYLNNGSHTCTYSNEYDNDYANYVVKFNTKSDSIKNAIISKTNDVNVCTLTNSSLEPSKSKGLSSYESIDYDFNPSLKLSYDDAKYGQKYTEFSADVKEVESPAPISYDYASDDFDSINGNIHFEYINSNQKQLKWVKTAKYNSLKYYYLSYSSLPSGILEYKNSQDDYNALNDSLYYKVGNNTYPTSLNATSGRKKFYFEIANIGVNPATGVSNNRFGRVATPKVTSNSKAPNTLQYSCYYNVAKDITGCDNPDDKSCYFYRNISLNNFNPNRRDLGPNWDNEKGQKTLEEIDSKGEDAYTEANVEYRFHLTPESMKKVREYNKSQSSYASGNLNKVDESKVDNSNGIQSIWVTSEFLSEALTKNYVTSAELKGRENFKAWDGTLAEGIGPAWK